MRITWSDVAEADLYDYIARDVPYYAEQFVDRLIEAVSLLKDHPRLGRRVPEAEEREDVRELIFQSYRIIISGRSRASAHTDRDPRQSRFGRAGGEAVGCRISQQQKYSQKYRNYSPHPPESFSSS
jgi:toxin ParE1/3/4